jgi:hypothetical protein
MDLLFWELEYTTMMPVSTVLERAFRNAWIFYDHSQQAHSGS